MIASSEDGMAILIALLFKVVLAAICASIASNRGRSAVGWFFVGLLLDCLGLILVLVLPDLKQQEARERRVTLENRRLKEQLLKERQVSDQRHQHVEHRLGVHDEALGVDTATPPALSNDRGAPARLTNGDEQWYYARNNERQGPVTAETIDHLLQAGAIDDDTLVWTDGMQDWQTIAETARFGGGAA